MSLDTFVHWDEKVPTREQLQAVLEDYVAGIGSVRWDEDRFFVDLPGVPSFPFKRMDDIPNYMKLAWEGRAKEHDGSPRTRWFEVWIDKDCIDIMTREMDEVTNNIARGFAELCARFWSGKIQ